MHRIKPKIRSYIELNKECKFIKKLRSYIMSSIKSFFNYTINPELLIITIITIILLLFILTKIIEKYKSTYTIYKKTDGVNNKIIKHFHTNNLENLNLIEKKINSITTRKDIMNFNEFIKIQDKSLEIIALTLDYSYLGNTTKQSLTSLQHQFTLDFHNISVENLQLFQIDLKILDEDIISIKNLLTTHRIFNEHSFPLEMFLSDYPRFIKFCRQNSKNAVITKMRNFKILSNFELKSFEESFRQFAHKHSLIETSEMFQLYFLVIEIFKEENTTVLFSIKRLLELERKKAELEKKCSILENKINLFSDLLYKLYLELSSLDEETRTTSSLRLLNPLSLNSK